MAINTLDADLGAYESAVRQRLQTMKANRFNERIWDKDPTLWKDNKEAKEMIPESLGWLSVAEEMADAVPELEKFAAEVHKAGYTHVVHMGMGGSSLAPLLFERTYQTGENGLELTVLDTTDPETIKEVEQHVPLEQTLFIVASKSGTTAEPNAFGDYFYTKLKSKIGDEAGAHFAVITDPGSPLIDKAKKRSYRKVFLNFKDIGGRYSALSYFGMVPAALMGMDVESFLERPLRMRKVCKTEDEPSKNPALRLGAIMGELALQGRDKLTLVLPDELSSLGMWLEQLVAESTGKEGKGILPVTGESLLKPDDYGDDRLFVDLHLKGREDHTVSNKLKQLHEAGHPVATITVRELEDIAQEFYRWEMAVAAAGAIIGINAFNQPNVQGSKDATDRLLKKVEAEGSLPASEPVLVKRNLRFFSKEKPDTAEELLRSFFNQAEAGDYISIQAYLTEEPTTGQLLQQLRTTLQRQFKLATTIGYGPRFLHSTGQYHKGGPNTGLFIQLTADDKANLQVPDTSYTFSVFKHAQALGDLESLRDHDRSVLKIDLNSNIHEGLDQLNDWISEMAPARTNYSK